MKFVLVFLTIFLFPIEPNSIYPLKSKIQREHVIVKRKQVNKTKFFPSQNYMTIDSINPIVQAQKKLKRYDSINDSLGTYLNQLLKSYSTKNPTEKVYLHTDKDIFALNEIIWYSGYVVLGTDHLFSLASKVLHIDLIGPHNQIIASQTQEVVNGKAIGSFQIPTTLSPGIYQLRSYTDWMRNFEPDFFFTKTINVVDTKENIPTSSKVANDSIDLQFFPEGGNAVAGIRGLVAFKAIGSDGLDKNIQGKIVDSKGEFVTSMKTMARGSGFISLSPKTNEQYIAILDNGSEYPLPKISPQGYTMALNNRNTKSFTVNVQASETLKANDFYIIGQINSKKCFEGKFGFNGKKDVQFKVQKKGLPSGVMTLTLFDQNKRPWCERVLFINNQEEIVITTNVNPKNLGKKAKVDLDVHVADILGNPISMELSLAVTDAGQFIKKEYSSNILTQLLLQSDLKGHINSPGLLFKDQKRETLQKLDLVMLTHGWRRIPWKKIAQDSFLKKKFKFSKGLSISGTARASNKKPLANTQLNIFAKDGKHLENFICKTSPNGRFSIAGINFHDSTQIVLNAINRRNKPIKAHISLDNDIIDAPKPNFRRANLSSIVDEPLYTEFNTAQRKFENLYLPRNTTMLDEVTVTKKIPNRTTTMPSVYGVAPDHTLYTKNFRGSMMIKDFVERLPGVIRSNEGVFVRGIPPLWVLDGVIIEDPEDFIYRSSTFDVERVELLRGGSASVFGHRGVGGVILIYSKRGLDYDEVHSMTTDFTIAGHAPAREFYSPKYDTKSTANDIPDLRATLYWNPSFTTDENGDAHLSFYNSDNANQIQVAVEGLSNQGKPGTYLKTFGEF